jgi:hypothetical protein
MPRQLLDATQGILVEMTTYEQLTGKLAIEALSPSFLVFSPDSGRPRPARPSPEVGVVAAAVGLVVAAPLMAACPGHQPGSHGRSSSFTSGRVPRPSIPARQVPHHARPDRGHGSVWHRDDEGRITRVGRWLRKLRLDERHS